MGGIKGNDVFQGGTENGFRLYAEVLVEILVFQGESRGSYGFGDIFEIDYGAFFFAMYFIEEVGPGPIVDLGRFDDEAVVDISRVREIFGDKREKRGCCKEAENEKGHEDFERDTENLPGS